MAELLKRREGAVGWIIFSNPARYNAMTFDMWRALPEALAAFDADPAVRVVVLAGDGDKAFVSGADISQFEQTRASEDARTEYNRVVEAAYLAPVLAAKPVVAKIRGICMGGGLGLAAACDVRVAADDAVFRMPAARLGLGYSFGGMRRFVQVLGAANTADIFFSARKFDAKDALRMGFVGRVVAAAELDREVGTYCALMAGERAAVAHLGQGGDPGDPQGPGGARPRGAPAADRRLLVERGLQGRAHGVHGKADAELQGPLTGRERRPRRCSAREFNPARDADAIVAGAGAAGLMAALAAAIRASTFFSLIVTSAVPRICRKGGPFPAADSRYQRDAGIEDRPARFASDVRAKGGGAVNDGDSSGRGTVGGAVHFLADFGDLPIDPTANIDIRSVPCLTSRFRSRRSQ